MKLPYFLAALALISSCALAASAETVTLSNGDRITGKISDSDGKTLTLTTDYAGDVKVKWTSIQTLVADNPLYVTTSDKTTVSGTVTPSAKTLTIHPATGAAVEVSYDKITAIRTGESETAFEKSRHPTMKQDWKGSGTLGLSLARGNSETTNLNTAVAVERKTPYDDFAVSESSIYSTDNQPGAGVTANAVLGAIKYNRDITAPAFPVGFRRFHARRAAGPHPARNLHWRPGPARHRQAEYHARCARRRQLHARNVQRYSGQTGTCVSAQFTRPHLRRNLHAQIRRAHHSQRIRVHLSRS